MVDLQDKMDVVSPQGTSSVSLDPRNCSPQVGDGQSSGLRSPQEREGDRKERI